ncbi:hypothetical protein EJ05DRAFT_475208 [Pseudovirgaria hyperparasitica]|uniref:Enhancer of mRNA-decapping protein 3 n=1 Tax=Pseudovirgaria hyperparasitica TaxID=470096 RepID=A0A6A6W7Y7_9PEZI|nr:uncharacterized protein EJ05DRAFT_475208 [Pseudovirgaria hyperparasitica]KAF2758972.1 hypothetical protein EJ05DRAFT_475208 [Pseudovirgaria hyperparasitica]
MASQFVGLLVAVTLVQPPNSVIVGRVAHVDERTSTLALQNVFYPATGERRASCTVEGRFIADIKIQQENAQPPPSVPASQPVPLPTVVPQPQWQAPPFQPPQRQQSHPQPTQQFQSQNGQRQQWPQYQHPGMPHNFAMPRGSFSSHPTQSPIAGAARQMPVGPTAPAKQSFVDPAILSMAKPPSAPAPELGLNVNQTLRGSIQEAPATPMKPPVEAAAPVSTQFTQAVAKPKRPLPVNHTKENVAATLTQPFSGMAIGDEQEEVDTDGPKGEPVRRVSLTKTRTGKPMESAKNEEDWKRTRRGGKGNRKKKPVSSAAQNTVGLDASPEVVKKSGGTIKGKGWRQTPLLKEEAPPGPKVPGVISGKVGIAALSALNKKEKRQKALERSQNGWATEDATDIQELPEFDFASNLAKFDKPTVFGQIRNEDTTADEDRLVSFNRVQHRPGTYGGKNIHPTENVLGGTKHRTQSQSLSSSESEVESERASRRNMSRASSRRNPQRSGSGVIPDGLPPHSTVPNLLVRNKAYAGPAYASSHATGSPKPSGRATPPESPLPSPMPQGNSRSACLRIVTSGRTCHTLSPGSMAAVEETAEVEFGLSEDIMAENAGRGVAEIALATINPGGRRLARENVALNSKPVIVVLVGNHRSGARAVAAARHVHMRGVRVMVTVVGFNRDPNDRDTHLRRQIDLFQAYGGSVRGWTDLELALKKLQAPPELIVDAVLGRHLEFDALADADRKEVLQMIGWANKSRAGVLAIEGPSGVAASTGEISILEGEPLELRAKHVVCLGAPRTGILRALDNGVSGAEWVLWVVDIGLNRPWKKAGISNGRGVAFGSDWVVKVEYVARQEDGAAGGGR